ncbi:MAG: PEP-CTERM sorting domain-containing protein [Opitutae bacterium]
MLSLCPPLAAQTAITAATFGPVVNNADQNKYTTPAVTYLETSQALSTFTTAGGVYSVQNMATNAYIRRNAVNANNSSVWYNGAATTALNGQYKATLNEVLLNNNVYMGTDNTFDNGAANTTGNIERLDFAWNAGIQIGLTDGFAVFERGAANGHDAFSIAVITGWDSVNNKPTTYSKQLSQAAAWGATNITTMANFQILRFGTGDALTNDTAVTAGTAQGLGGLMFTLQDFGLAANTTIYGYSIMEYRAAPVAAGALLADWTNTTYYPTNSAPGVDLSGINGLMFSKTPEPSTYGALLVGATAGLLGWRRHRRRVSARAA